MNTTITNIKIPESIVKLTQNVLGERRFTIKDWDVDRVYIDVDTTNDDYTIRMWDVTEDYIRWTLFKTIWDNNGGGHGEAESEGVFELNERKVSEQFGIKERIKYFTEIALNETDSNIAIIKSDTKVPNWKNYIIKDYDEFIYPEPDFSEDTGGACGTLNVFLEIDDKEYEVRVAYFVNMSTWFLYEIADGKDELIETNTNQKNYKGEFQQRSKKEESSYYGEISLAVRAETKQSIEELKNKYDVGGLKIKLVLESHYGEEEITPEVLEIWSAEWGEWDEL